MWAGVAPLPRGVGLLARVDGAQVGLPLVRELGDLFAVLADLLGVGGGDAFEGLDAFERDGGDVSQLVELLLGGRFGHGGCISSFSVVHSPAVP